MSAIDEIKKIHVERQELFARKNADYSPWNVILMGEQGLALRLLDKVVRLCSLYGYNFDTKLFESLPKKPSNETIEDTWIDIGNYSDMGLVVRRGKWYEFIEQDIR